MQNPTKPYIARHFWALILLVSVFSCTSISEQQDDSAPTHDTDQMSYNPETGEFLVDKDTRALWHCNTGKDILIFDASPHEHDGEIVNAQWTEGRFGKGLEFGTASSDSYVFVPHTEKLSLSQAVTLEGWFWVRRVRTINMPLLVKTTIFQDETTYAYPNYAFWIRTQGGHADFPHPSIWWWIMGEIGEQYDYALDSSQVFRLEDLYEQWLYLAGTYNGQYSRFYINGRLVAEKKIDGLLRTSHGGDIYIGSMKPNQTDGANYFGIIDELRISAIARSSKAIADYYNTVKEK